MAWLNVLPYWPRPFQQRLQSALFEIEQMKTLALAIATACLSASSAFAAPFGIPQGTPIKTLKVIKSYGGKSFVVMPPTPNPKFSEYDVIATPVHGVCAVIGTTQPYRDYKLAYQEQGQIEKLLARYGKSKPVRPGPQAPRLYMRPSEGPVMWKGGLPDHLSEIVLETIEQGGTFYVQLQYFYRNMSQCKNWEPQQDHSGL